METPAAPADSLTPSQRRAVRARGNVLVMAGAGTGKTKTLVERCLDCLEHDGAAVDELLVVTFTEAAAAEMRQRLLRAIEARSQDGSAQPTPEFWSEQLARFDLAHIGTLHSFCLKLVREHFYELGLDPRLALLDEGEARQLANETLDELFHSYYAGEDEFSLAVQELVQVHGGGRDEKIRALILRLHHYSQARPDAGGWLAGQGTRFADPEPADWRRWLPEALTHWHAEWRPVLENLQGSNEKAAELAALFAHPEKSGGLDGVFLDQIIAADGDDQWPNRRKTVLREPLKELFAGAKFLRSLFAGGNSGDPLAEDWSWIRPHMETLIRLTQAFTHKLDERKRAEGKLDFHDLEQFALKLLWDFSANRPAPAAMAARRKLKFVFVDEYQDINAAQDRIIAALSRDGGEANRFLVGDVKQSIYRFRLADPKIFRDYARHWRPPDGETIPLSENFRSRAGLLDFVNSLFRHLMRADVGGVNYDAAAELKPGGPAGDRPAGTEPCTELLVRFKAGRPGFSEEENDDLAGLDDAQREARLVAWRLKQLRENRHRIFDAAQGEWRAVEWRDMAILLRSPRGRSAVFVQEFERAGIPLAVARGCFYESAEILDLLSLLQLLDNPLQDVPCLAVLRSPLVGLSLDELAELRLASRERHFWAALVRRPETAAGKIQPFLERFYRWRKLVKQVSLSQCLEGILAETFYLDWLRAQPRGAQRAANVAGFLQLAQQFDQFQRQGLFHFLKFVEAQREAEVEPEVSPAAAENAVRLMSIHQSKGLEFPVVVLADLAKRFNDQDLRGEIIFDEAFGPCPRVKPPHTGRRYPSLPYWLAQRRQRRELSGEEMRLLYVALTRARDHLILTANITEKSWAENWRTSRTTTTQAIAGARSYADWLALWFASQLPPDIATIPAQGTVDHLRWQVVTDEILASLPDETVRRETSSPWTLEAPAVEELRRRLEWSYPFAAATRRKAKSSVTALRRETADAADEAEKPFQTPGFTLRPKTSRAETTTARRPSSRRSSRLNAAEIGAAHHKFLQYVALDKTGDLAAEADRLVRDHYLSPAERDVLDLEALAGFWNSPLGKKIVAHAPRVRRELPFTARFSPAELAAITHSPSDTSLKDEFVVVQGVADLAVLLPDEIWVVDFKTDDIGRKDLPARIAAYRPQIQLYAAALEKIFNRPVTLRALHFLAAGQTENVQPPAETPRKSGL